MINMSPSINELALALAKAQKEISKAELKGSNPFFKGPDGKASRYADLGAAWDACRVPLNENGLSISQWVCVVEGQTGLVTMLLHLSGQFISSFFPFIIEKPTMQGLGGAITYAKRYALMSAVGIAEEDDDGNTASKFPKAQASVQPQAVTPKSDGAIIYEKLLELKLDLPKCKEFLTLHVGKDSFKKIDKKDLPILLEKIEELKRGMNQNETENFDTFK